MYPAFYELQEEPFRLTPDPRFLHLAEPHRAALTLLVQGVVLRKGFVMVTGPVGTGKTTLLHAALQILHKKSLSTAPLASAFLINPTLSRDEFLEALLQEFEISCPSASKAQRLAALHQMLLEMQRRGGTAVLLIDEAHLLSAELLEEIRLLSNADTYREKLLQIVLSGQPELAVLVAKPELHALKQRIASRCALRALSFPETRAYIAERLHAAGLRGTSPFPAPTLEAIYRSTQGVPRLINLICGQCLEAGFATERRVIGPDLVEDATVALDLAETAPVGPVRSAPNRKPPEPNASRSTVDILSEAIRQGRVTTQE
jgi:general secretion pathway protein A